MKKRFGFTLAEVLITLGIIGVVAAMTIPTLMQNTNSARFVSQFKKDISTLSQAGLMGQAQWDTDYSGVVATTAANCTSDNADGAQISICGLLNSTLSGSAHITAYSITDGVMHNYTSLNYIQLADGSVVGVNPNAAGCHAVGQPAANTLAFKAGSTSGTFEAASTATLNNCLGFIDVNGQNPPNREIACSGNGESNALSVAAGNCTITSTGSQVGDVFPVLFHDGIVEPASTAARAALLRK